MNREDCIRRHALDGGSQRSVYALYGESNEQGIAGVKLRGTGVGVNIAKKIKGFRGVLLPLGFLFGFNLLGQMPAHASSAQGLSQKEMQLSHGIRASEAYGALKEIDSDRRIKKNHEKLDSILMNIRSLEQLINDEPDKKSGDVLFRKIENLKINYYALIGRQIADIERLGSDSHWSERLINYLGSISLAHYGRIVLHESAHLHSNLSDGVRSMILSNRSATVTYDYFDNDEDEFNSKSAGVEMSQAMATALVKDLYKTDSNMSNSFMFGYLTSKNELNNYSNLTANDSFRYQSSQGNDLAGIIVATKADISIDDIRKSSRMSFLLSGGTINILRNLASGIWNMENIYEVNNKKSLRLETQDGYLYLPEIETQFDYEKGVTQSFTFFYQKKGASVNEDKFYSFMVNPKDGGFGLEITENDGSGLFIGDKSISFTFNLGDNVKADLSYDYGAGVGIGLEKNVDIDFSKRIKIPPKLRELFIKSGVDPDNVEIAEQEVISGLQILAIAYHDKQAMGKLGLTTQGGSVFTPRGEDVVRYLARGAESDNPQVIETYLTKKLTTIRAKASMLLAADNMEDVLSGVLNIETLLGGGFSAEALVSANAFGVYAKALFGVNSGNRTFRVGAEGKIGKYTIYDGKYVEQKDLVSFGPLIESVDWNESGQGFSVGGDFDSLTGANLSFGSESKMYGDENIKFRVGFADIANVLLGLYPFHRSFVQTKYSPGYYLSSILDLHPIITRNPGVNVTDPITGEVFGKYGKYFASISKNPEDKKKVVDIMLKLTYLVKSGKGIWIDSGFSKSLGSNNLEKFRLWLDMNMQKMIKGSSVIKFKGIDKDGNIEVEIGSTNDYKHPQFAKRHEIRVKGKSQLFFDFLNENSIKLDIAFDDLTNKDIKGILIYFERLAVKDGLEKFRHRTVRIVEEKLFQSDVSYLDEYATVIEIEKNVLHELYERHGDRSPESQDIDIVNEVGFIEGLGQIKGKIVSLAKRKSIDVSRVVIVKRNNAKLYKHDELPDDINWDGTVDYLNHFSDLVNIKIGNNGEIYMSDYFVRELILSFDNKRHWAVRSLSIKSEDTSLVSLRGFDRNLERDMMTQDQRLSSSARHMGESRYENFRKYTDIYMMGDEVRQEYDVYDVMNKRQNKILVSLKKNDSIVVKVNGSSVIYNLNGTGSHESLGKLQDDYPGISKLLFGQKGITSISGEQDQLSGLIADMIKFRNEVN